MHDRLVDSPFHHGFGRQRKLILIPLSDRDPLAFKNLCFQGYCSLHPASFRLLFLPLSNSQAVVVSLNKYIVRLDEQCL